jgi:hypothetical protein
VERERLVDSVSSLRAVTFFGGAHENHQTQCDIPASPARSLSEANDHRREWLRAFGRVGTPPFAFRFAQRARIGLITRNRVRQVTKKSGIVSRRHDNALHEAEAECVALALLGASKQTGRFFVCAIVV